MQLLIHGVTLGAKELDSGYRDVHRPVVGHGVMIGSGAKILGGISIGDGVRIGANTVVIELLPAGTLAVGGPARIIQS